MKSNGNRYVQVMVRKFVKFILSPFIQVTFEKFFLNCRRQFRILYLNFGEEQTLRLLPWIKSGFDSPSPNIVKWHVMKKWGGCGTWIETGTYLGETTRFLSTFSKYIVSLEPADKLYSEAKNIF
jgi:hypothetical protein